MRVAFWIVAALLAVFYLFSGVTKVARSKDQLRPMMGWVDSVPLWFLRTIGVLEVLGAVGLILPPLTGVGPRRARSTALHLSRGEAKVVPLNIVLLALAVVAIWLSTTWL
jgi:hypothetical protein